MLSAFYNDICIIGVGGGGGGCSSVILISCYNDE